MTVDVPEKSGGFDTCIRLKAKPSEKKIKIEIWFLSYKNSNLGGHLLGKVKKNIEVLFSPKCSNSN